MLKKKTKQAYCKKNFETNGNNIRNTWKGIICLICLKTVTSSVPTVISLDSSDTITNPYNIANIFNNYFGSITETIRKAYQKDYQTILGMKSALKYFCILSMKKI